MDASFAQSAIVWAALGIGLASVLYCVFSGAPLTSENAPEDTCPAVSPPAVSNAEPEVPASADTSS